MYKFTFPSFFVGLFLLSQVPAFAVHHDLGQVEDGDENCAEITGGTKDGVRVDSVSSDSGGVS